MSTRDERIRLEVTGAQQSARDLDKVGDAADHAARSVSGMGTEADRAARNVDQLGEQATGTGRQLSRLDRQIAETRRELHRLNDEFERTGDEQLLTQFDQHEASLARLERRSRTLGRLNRDLAEEAARDRPMLLRDVMGGDNNDRRGFFGRARSLGSSAGQGAAGVGNFVADKAFNGDIKTALMLTGGALAAPAALAVTGGAVISAGAAGAVGAGVAGALSGPAGAQIKGEFQGILDDLTGRWKAATANWVGPLLNSAEKLHQTLDRLPLEDIAKEAREFVEPLTVGLAGLLEGAVRGVDALVKNAGPEIKILAEKLPELGRAIETSLTAISREAPGGAQALGDIVTVVGVLIKDVGVLIMGMEQFYSKVRNTPVTAPFELLGAALEVHDVKLRAVGRSLDGTSASTSHYVDVQKMLADSAREASDQLDRQLGILLSAGEAADRATKATKDLNDSFAENGYSIEGNTDKALANRDAIHAAERAWETERTAAIEAGDGSKAAIDKANAALLAHLEKLRAILVAHGQNTTELDEYIAAVKRASGLVLITTFRNVYENVGTPNERQRTGQSRLGNMGQYASGGTVRATGVALVGEQGPELVFMRGGDQVLNAADTARLRAGGGSSGGGGEVRHVIDLRLNGTTIRELVVTGAADRGQTVAQYLGI